MNFQQIVALGEGPARTAAVTAWIQSLFDDDDSAPILVGGAAVDGVNAFLLWWAQEDRIDAKRLERRARQSGWNNAQRSLLRFSSRWSRGEVSTEKLEQWATAGP